MAQTPDDLVQFTTPKAAKSGRGGDLVKHKYFRITKSGGGGDGELDAAATTKTFSSIFTVPANSIILGIARDVAELVAGGSISAVTLDVGPTANNDGYIDAADVFTGATADVTREDPTAPGDGVALAALPGAIATAVVVDAVVTTTGDDTDAATAGDIEIVISYMAYEDPDA